ncbi:MAG: tetratricopeptide repeat protein [Planctomycetes bacterium]|nr:tetratricopeptide repeat protein [Planctomycetota bacterium]
MNAASRDGIQSRQLKILDPLDGAVFPPEIAAPTFRWEDAEEACDAWRIECRFQDGSAMEFRSRSAGWTPSEEQWETIKRHSLESKATVTVLGVNEAARNRILSRASISISTSKDEVGAPLFYREVNLPFLDAVRDPTGIRWRFGAISSKQQPPVVLEKLPVCGNCHSFSADGTVLGMDVDYANDKGSYVISPVTDEMVLDKGKIITWNDYRKEDGEQTFGLLSQVSPDGRYVVSTVKDRSVFVPKGNLAFSQLFFPIKGILAFFDRETKGFRPLSGADDPRFVQSNPTWSPDGKSLVFARSTVHHLKNVRDTSAALLTQEDCAEFLTGGKTFLFDLYRIPFNDGKGGEPVPLEGASHNGMSNYFPKFSPDGKWIVFCKAKSFMLLQPDSELHIVPAQGGQARRMRCNTSRMNSWHSWSPNGKWLVFSSKAYSAYTQLFLAHIDEQGQSSVPVLLSRFSGPNRAANIPEFVNVETSAIQKISEAFVDDHSFYRAAMEQLRQDDAEGAASLLRKSLELNPSNAESRIRLADILARNGKSEDAKPHLLKILELQPSHVLAHYGLADILSREGKPGEAKAHLSRILELRPDHANAHCGLALLLYKEARLQEAADHCRQALHAEPNHHDALTSLGLILLDSGKPEESVEPLVKVLRLDPKNALANYLCGRAFHHQNKLQEAAGYYRRAIQCDPDQVPAMLGLASIRIIDAQPETYNIDEAIALAKRACDVTRDQDPAAMEILAGVYAAAGRLDDAVITAGNALRVALAVGDQDLAERLRENLELYERGREGR